MLNEDGNKYAEAVLKVKVGEEIEHPANFGLPFPETWYGICLPTPLRIERHHTGKTNLLVLLDKGTTSFTRVECEECFRARRTGLGDPR